MFKKANPAIEPIMAPDGAGNEKRCDRGAEALRPQPPPRRHRGDQGEPRGKRPIPPDRRQPSATNEVLAGNHTLGAAKELGWKKIAVTFVEADPEQAKRIVLVDNRANDLAGYDAEALVELLEELDGLRAEPATSRMTSTTCSTSSSATESPGEDDPPRPRPSRKTKPGDLYLLGRHRLLCGDARDPAAYKRLLGEERVDRSGPIPPTASSYEGKTAAALRIEGRRRGRLAGAARCSLRRSTRC